MEHGHRDRPYMMWKNVVNRGIISAISQNQSTSENNFWVDMTGYDFTRFAFQGCFGIHVFKCFQFWLWDRAIKIHRLSYRESTVEQSFCTFFHLRWQQTATNLVACMPVEIFMRQGVWASISKGSVMVRSNGLLLLGLVPHLASKLFASFIFSWEVLLVLVIPALSFIALLNDDRKCLVSVHLTRADFWFVIPTIPPESFESFMLVFQYPYRYKYHWSCRMFV